MGYKSYDELLADAENYKKGLEQEVYSIKSNFEAAKSNNDSVSSGIVTPQVIIKKEVSKVPYLIAGIVVVYLIYSKGYLK